MPARPVSATHAFCRLAELLTGASVTSFGNAGSLRTPREEAAPLLPPWCDALTVDFTSCEVPGDGVLVTFDFLEAFDISLIVMDIPGICRPPVSETSAVSHVSWSAANPSGLARRGHTGGLWEGQ